MRATKRWWKVLTKENNEWGREYLLAVCYGYMDEIALHLADKAQGFYQDVGTLIFKPVKPPSKRYVKKRDRVNIQVYDQNNLLVGRAGVQRMVTGRHVELRDSNYCDCTLLVSKMLKRKA